MKSATNEMPPRLFCVLVAAVIFFPAAVICAGASSPHDAAFWKAIKEANFAVPAAESAGQLALELPALAASTDPAVRDGCGYEILAAWVYRDHLLSAEQLEALRLKLLPGMTAHLGELENETIFGRSFSALYLSILAAEDLRHPFLSPPAFRKTLDLALESYAREKDLRGYVPGKGWAHATAHVADLLKFLGRSPHLSREEQKLIVNAIAQRCRSAGSVFAHGEDARMAAALLSIAERKDCDVEVFRSWCENLGAEFDELWKSADLNLQAYGSVRLQSDVLVHLMAKIAARNDATVPKDLRERIGTTVSKVD
ncbi:MAG TPA: DUF2785 domain-containing protein [Chthoniobacterales bacterium]|nr:DUF2785 domain-containing protein [Chthoniobacterales bacterium]